MPLYVGGLEVSGLRVGVNTPAKAYLGAQQVWAGATSTPDPGPGPDPDPGPTPGGGVVPVRRDILAGPSGWLGQYNMSSLNYICAQRFEFDTVTTIDRWYMTINGEGSSPIGGRSAYGNGNGGRWFARICAVNQSTGFPILTEILAQETVAAAAAYSRAKSEFGLGQLHQVQWAQFAPLTLQPGVMYAFLLSNTDPSPGTGGAGDSGNHMSVNLSFAEQAKYLGPNDKNTLDPNTPGAVNGWGPRECTMWSADKGQTWRFGNQIGWYQVGRPWSRWWTCGYRVAGGQSYSHGWPASNWPGNGRATITYHQSPRAVTLTRAGGFSADGTDQSRQTVGTVTVTNVNTGVSGTTPVLAAGAPSGPLSPSVPIRVGDSIRISCSGAVELSDLQEGHGKVFDLGNRVPFDFDCSVSNRIPSLWAAPWPFFPSSGSTGGGGGGSTPASLQHRVVGVPTSATGRVAVRTTGATSVRLKVGTDPDVTAGVLFGSLATPNAQGNTQLTVAGLSPGTQYYYRVAMTSGGSETLDTGQVGQFRTAPSGQTSFAFCFGSCADTADAAVFSTIAARGDDLFFHLGDAYYTDGASTALSNFRATLTGKLGGTNQGALYSTTPSVFTPSDHDGMADDSTAGTNGTAWTNYNAAYRELIPTPALNGSTGVYYTFPWGRLRFIVLDGRSFKSNPSNTDNSSKTVLGATQKQWLKDTITAATEPVIVIAQADPWHGSPNSGEDNWLGYTTERTELANFFAASGKRIVMLAGDMHALAAEDGSSSPGGVAIFHAAPFHADSSIKGGPYDVGPYPSSASSTIVRQYGRVVVTDSGSQISLAYTGYSSDNTQRVTLTKTFTLP